MARKIHSLSTMRTIARQTATHNGHALGRYSIKGWRPVARAYCSKCRKELELYEERVMHGMTRPEVRIYVRLQLGKECKNAN